MLALALVVLAGYVLHIDELKHVVPGFASMKANTAIGLALVGASALAMAETPQGQRRLRSKVPEALAAGAAAIGALTLGEYLTGRSFGIDELLFDDTLAGVATSAPGRMSPLTAANFVLSGAALVLLDRPRWRGMAGWLLAPVSLGAAFVFTNYLYGATFLAAYTQVALHTAAAFLLVTLAGWSLRDDSGPARLLWRTGPVGHLARRLLPMVLLVPLAAGYVRARAAQSGAIGELEGIAAFALTMAVVLVGFTWILLRRLELADERRGRAEAAAQRTAERIE